MSNPDQPSQLQKLKRLRKTARTLITKFTTVINDATPSSEIDYEYNQIRLQEALDRLTTLDQQIHDVLPDTEYNVDVISCEEYTDLAKRAILKATRAIGEKTPVDNVSLASAKDAAVPPPPLMHTVKLPVIRLEPFSGDVEKWSRFWEQFQSSIDGNPSISSIDKHVFLRGYLEDEPKNLVDGIPITADAYEETKQILISRYGDKNRIIQAHLDYLETLQPISHVTPNALNMTFIECNRRIQALRALGENVDEYGRMLAPKILRAFPEDIVRRWIIHAKRENIMESHITKLMRFLNEEVDGALTTQKIRGNPIASATLIPTTAALQIHAKSSKSSPKAKKTILPFCVFCDRRGHWGQDCKTITTVYDRIQKLKSNKRCFLCLNQGHVVSDCSKKGQTQCATCKKLHHRSICDGEQRTLSTPSSQTAVGKISVATSGFTYLQTAQVWITGPTGLSKLTRCVLDAGSQSTFISKSLVDDLQLEVIRRQELTVCAFESNPTSSNTRRLVRFNMKGFWTNTSVSLYGFESLHVLSPQPSVPQDITALAHARKLQLADPRTDSHEDLPVELLIGSDHYWKIIRDSPPLRVSTSLVLVPSTIGWILSGDRSGMHVNSATVNFINLEQASFQSDEDFRRFWDLETIGITADQERPHTPKDSRILEDFKSSFRIEEQRRVVSLPKKQGILELPHNLHNAEARLSNLQKRLQSNDDFNQMYCSQMFSYIHNQHVEEVNTTNSPEVMFYLPHQAVKKERYGKTKWRIVFDASSHQAKSPSLNDMLEMGPNLLPEAVAILLRFRLHRQGIISDIQQAFLQLTLDRKDRDLTRFLWYKVIQDDGGHFHTTNDIVTYRFTRLPFGLTCSPFLLSATIREHADKHTLSFPNAAPLINSNTFMDDIVVGAADDNLAVTLYYELTALMKMLNFPLAKWATNSDVLRAVWKAEGRETALQTQVLGINWCTSSDSFMVDTKEILDKIPEGPTTKRQLLKIVSSFYDPLGLFTPVSLVGKRLFQDTWCRGIDWNELLPNDLAAHWHAWISTLSSLSPIRIPRWLHTSSKEDTQVHVFCDASERAYGAALYIRATNEDTISTHLAYSKSRLTPVKKVTLPRLELLAALVGARLLRYFAKATNFDTSHATLWTDSTVTLGWIRGNPNKWKTFVCNRVTEIQSYTTPSQWRHCPGTDNPADHLSRGLLPGQIQSLDIWWHGPSWLTKEDSYWPQDAPSLPSLPETKNTVQTVLHVDLPESIIDSTQFSSYTRLLRVTAWVLRLTRILRHKDHENGELTAQELIAARTYWIKVVQKDCFPAELGALQSNVPLPVRSKLRCYNPFLEDGVLRLGGRLESADITHQQRHPIILDGDHHFTQLMIRDTHIRLHHLGVRIVLSDLRMTFWILRARRAIKKILYRCLPCKMARNRPSQVLEAQLPPQRVIPQKAFAVTGIDFAGPLYVREGHTTKKCYITLFTCATTRALHLELCRDMSTDKFLQALQRFVARRGIPHTIYSDNAQTFHCANRELAGLWATVSDTKACQYLSRNNITWKFIAPRAAWWGGWWERMVGSTKRCLRKTLGRSSVDEDGLQTILTSIEAALNSRPLTKDDDANVLTPAHFLVGGQLNALPSGPEPQPGCPIKEYRLQQQLADHFWKRWSKEYLLQLQSFHQVKQPKGTSPRLRLGDIVLLQDEVRPRHLWRKARIQELKPGRDGLIRTVILSTPEGTQIARPVQLVIPLEVDQGGEDVGE